MRLSVSDGITRTWPRGPNVDIPMNSSVGIEYRAALLAARKAHIKGNPPIDVPSLPAGPGRSEFLYYPATGAQPSVSVRAIGQRESPSLDANCAIRRRCNGLRQAQQGDIRTRIPTSDAGLGQATPRQDDFQFLLGYQRLLRSHYKVSLPDQATNMATVFAAHGDNLRGCRV